MLRAHKGLPSTRLKRRGRCKRFLIFKLVYLITSISVKIFGLFAQDSAATCTVPSTYHLHLPCSLWWSTRIIPNRLSYECQTLRIVADGFSSLNSSQALPTPITHDASYMLSPNSLAVDILTNALRLLSYTLRTAASY
ncbi:hypothetical protein ARMGADRAFT_443109 [Armillaria gallica]|uniref:Uncharacterized protein n=1 Tax=Armillaria gallica TaxID=47427 RepID=A0A2H3D9M2_ARMGA|nr:hypothetical protein ARMGADRAFT_443109 [Armillaria gallica]